QHLANPYQVVQGLALDALTLGARVAFVALKASFAEERARVTRAVDELQAAGLAGDVPITVVGGPEEYLFGEEKALLEVIEGKPPLPRIVPPFMEGLFRTPDSPNPTVVNNVETLSNVPHILRNGAEWFRSFGTDRSPGTMVFT